MTRLYKQKSARFLSDDDRKKIEALYLTHSDSIIGDIIGRSRHGVRNYRNRHNLIRPDSINSYPEHNRLGESLAARRQRKEETKAYLDRKAREAENVPDAPSEADPMTKLLAARW